MDMPVRPAAPTIEAYPLKFTGAGGVYFGVWLVNLLLMAVTLGLFTPFARRRTLKYFHGHTEVAGHPLEFTAGMKRMFLGFLLFFGLYLAYSIASNTGQALAAGLLGAGAVLLTPFLWASAVRFRAASTRWRGIRGRFGAGWGEVYAASWPLLGLAVVGAAGGAALAVLRGTRPALTLVAAAGVLALAAIVLCIVRLSFNYARLRVLKTDFGGLAGHWKVGFGDWLKISLQAIGLFVAIAAVLLTMLLLVTGGSLWVLAADGPRSRAAFAMILMAMVGGFVIVLLAASPARAWAEACIHRLVWNKVGLGRAARFKCNLRPWRYVGLRLKNLLLSLITLGFWRPFAITSEYAMKLESVTLHVKGGLDQLAGQLVIEQGAFGDAVADAVGFDAIG